MSAEESRPQRVGIAADHGGVNLKDQLVLRLSEWGFDVQDLGTRSGESVDYPDYAAKVAQGLQAGDFDAGVLVCGTGLGMSIMANRFKGVRAAVCTTEYMAAMARAHNDANVLCLGERVVGLGQAEAILRAYLETAFEGGRHARRISKFDP